MKNGLYVGLVAVLLVAAFVVPVRGFNGMGAIGGGGVTSSTQLSDTSNIAYKNQANTFSIGGQVLNGAASASTPVLAINPAAGQTGNLFEVSAVGNPAGKVLALDSSGYTHGNIFFCADNGGFYNESQTMILRTLDGLYLGASMKVNQYLGVNTAGWGVPAIYGTGRVTAQNAAAAAITTYTVGAADGTFLISGNVNVTTATTHSFTMTCTYTDETNTSRTATLPFTQVGGVPLVTITNVTGIGPYEGLPIRIRCKTATAITIQTVGTFTAVVYNAEADITQLK